MTTRTRKLRPHPSSRGLTLVEVIAVVVVIGVAVALAVGAAQPRTQKEAHIAKCANNLRLLAAAAHCYADDFEEKFFIEHPRRRHNLGGYEVARRWWDRDLVGRYLVGEELAAWSFSQVVTNTETGQAFEIPKQEFDNNAGLGDGPFRCPADIGGRAPDGEFEQDSPNTIGFRSYDQNGWARGIDPDSLPNNPNPVGDYFDRTTEGPIDRLILFGEAYSTKFKVEKRNGEAGWATQGMWALRDFPSERFAGYTLPPRPIPAPLPGDFGRWPKVDTARLVIDYSRHANNHQQNPYEGGTNIAYVDGHVAWNLHSELYDPKTRVSTYVALWSPIDPEIDSGKEP